MLFIQLCVNSTINLLELLLPEEDGLFVIVVAAEKEKKSCWLLLLSSLYNHPITADVDAILEIVNDADLPIVGLFIALRYHLLLYF